MWTEPLNRIYFFPINSPGNDFKSMQRNQTRQLKQSLGFRINGARILAAIGHGLFRNQLNLISKPRAVTN